MRVPWTSRRSNQSILKEINCLIFIGRTDAEAEVPMLLPPDLKTLKLGNTEGRRKRGQQRMKPLDGITDSMDITLQTLEDSEGQGSLEYYSPWGCKEFDMI